MWELHLEGKIKSMFPTAIEGQGQSQGHEETCCILTFSFLDTGQACDNTIDEYHSGCRIKIAEKNTFRFRKNKGVVSPLVFFFFFFWRGGGRQFHSSQNSQSTNGLVIGQW